MCTKLASATRETTAPRLLSSSSSRATSCSEASWPVEITPGWLGRWFIRTYIEPSPETRRRRAPKKIAPGARVEPAVLDRFLGSNDEARALVRRASSYDVNRVRFRNPFVPLIRFTVGTGLEVLTRHQRRHLLQAERIRDAMER